MKALDQGETITSRAREAIRRAILNGDLQPGQLYAVNSVAQTLGVSRTPAREALIQLSAEGMVQFERNRGFVVRHATAEDLREIFALRLLLEVPATYAAAQIATKEQTETLEEHLSAMREEELHGDAESFLAADRGFHRSLLLIAGNVRLADYVDSLRNVVLMSGVSTAGRTESIEQILEPHITILEYVSGHEAEAAADAMREHIVNTGRLLLRQDFGDDAVTEFEAHLLGMKQTLPPWQSGV